MNLCESVKSSECEFTTSCLLFFLSLSEASASSDGVRVLAGAPPTVQTLSRRRLPSIAGTSPPSKSRYHGPQPRAHSPPTTHETAAMTKIPTTRMRRRSEQRRPLLVPPVAVWRRRPPQQPRRHCHCRHRSYQYRTLQLLLPLECTGPGYSIYRG